MGKITTASDLKNAIRLLEDKQAKELPLLKEQFLTTYESLRPINLIKNTFSELTAAPDFKEGILNTTLSLAAGYLSKKVIIGSTWNPLKQLFGTILQMGITNIVSKNAEVIRSVATQVVDTILTKKEKSV